MNFEGFKTNLNELMLISCTVLNRRNASLRLKCAKNKVNLKTFYLLKLRVKLCNIYTCIYSI